MASDVRQPRVLVAVTGGIAAYKAVEFSRLLTQSGFRVQVVMTRGAQNFVGAATFAALTDEPVITGEWTAGDSDPERAAAGQFPHLDAGREADVLVVAPATANVLARMAAGIADDVVTSTYLAFDGPVLVAPAMNVRMWEHPATRRALDQLRADGVVVIEPEAGLLACGDVGAGRLAPVEEIAAAVQRVVDGVDRSQDLAGRVVLVTAGGTREPVDDVRVLANRSSGRMGIALARAASERGAAVRLVVTTGVAAADLAGIEPVARVESTADLAAAVDEHRRDADVVVMAAAPADFTVVRAPGKLARGATTSLELVPTDDILAGLAQQRGAEARPLLVGFAAESGEGGVERARGKLERKGIDLIVHNDVSRADIGFEGGHNEVTILAPGRDDRHVPRAAKLEVAHAILDEVATALAVIPTRG